MRIAEIVATRSTCKERSVGCIITSSDYENVYSIGYNGGAKGFPNSCDGKGVKCGCIHAEINALTKCFVKDPYKVMFITLSPCIMCAKSIINSGVSKVYYRELHKDVSGVQLLKSAGIQVIKLGAE